MAQNNLVANVAIADPGAAAVIPVLTAPTDAFGGGLTVQAVEAEVHTSVTNSLGVGGTTFTLQLLKYSSAGTPVVNGTVSTNTVGGTAVGWTAGVPQTFTLDSDYVFLDAGESLRANYAEVNAGSPTGNVVVTVHYVRGK